MEAELPKKLRIFGLCLQGSEGTISKVGAIRKLLDLFSQKFSMLSGFVISRMLIFQYGPF